MILSSKIIAVGPPQIDGRQYVTESHTSDDGRIYQIEYLADGMRTFDAIMSERAAALSAELENLAIVDARTAAADSKFQQVISDAVDSGAINEDELRSIGQAGVGK